MYTLLANTISSIQTGSSLPNIVTDNLALWLDVNVPTSYSGGTTWTDISPNGNVFNLVGPPSLVNNRLEFDGINDYAICTNLVGDPYQVGTGEITLEYWINFRGTGDGIVDNRDQALASQWVDYLSTSNNSYRTFLNNSGTQLTPSGLNINTFNQFVFKRFSVNIWYTYVNGQYIGARIANINISGTHSQLVISGSYTTNTKYQNDIGIIRVYKGKALTDAEVLQNFNAQKDIYGL
jgi:hypothetical protein